MTQQVIDGKAVAAALRERIAYKTRKLKDEHELTPGLAVILVGDNPASEVYVRNKKAKTAEVGMRSFEAHFPDTISQKSLLAQIDAFNHNSEVHGILVQLPLPAHIDTHTVIGAIAPAKDVDGFHVANVGKLVTGQPDALISCTPLGCLMLISDVISKQAPLPSSPPKGGEGTVPSPVYGGGLGWGRTDLSGLHAVVLGRSNIVGKPMAQLLLSANATVTICHSRTTDIAAMARRADILVAAIGKPEIVRADWVKDGAVVIDVGINRVDGKLVGDVDFDAVAAKAAAITPVPGGVGPMTIACLLRNTLQAACAAKGIDFAN